ncbi:hypothetical protein FACS1894202_09300 [Clostridia bacterium]|nr:hypothetical protein FACS1894202_09300 [Clostridia bacterium]
MKKGISLILCLAILISCVSVSAFAYVIPWARGEITTTVNGNVLLCSICHYTADTNQEMYVVASWYGAPATVIATMEAVNYYTGATFFPKTQDIQYNSNIADAWRYPALSATEKIRVYGRAEVSGSGYYGITPVYSVILNG